MLHDRSVRSRKSARALRLPGRRPCDPCRPTSGNAKETAGKLRFADPWEWLLRNINDKVKVHCAGPDCMEASVTRLMRCWSVVLEQVFVDRGRESSSPLPLHFHSPGRGRMAIPCSSAPATLFHLARLEESAFGPVPSTSRTTRTTRTALRRIYTD